MLKTLAAQALRLADATRAVQQALGAAPLAGPVRILAIGKAALPMWQGADAVLGAQVRAGLVIQPDSGAHVRSSLTPSRPYPFHCLTGAHPLPDARSLAAGAAAQQFVSACAPDETLLVLLSGGASALCEVLPDDLRLEAFQALQQLMLASAWPISAINAVRQRLSRIKAGGLLRCCPPTTLIRQLLLSDVPGDDPAVIGSAPFVPAVLPLPDWRDLPAPWPAFLQRWLASPVPAVDTDVTRVTSTIIASNAHVRAGLQQWAAANGHAVIVNRAIAGDCAEVAAALAAEISAGPPGLYLYGGETHLQLPVQPGRGGRNQHLALLLQQALVQNMEAAACRASSWQAQACSVLTLATDGVDGNSDAAGAWFRLDPDAPVQAHAKAAAVTGASCSSADAATALRDASSYDYWRQQGGLLFTGATGSNVADLVLCWKSDHRVASH
ncbi:MAG TPA: DUF4147 domain-containing protein [Permianibacter sp.]|nr:DUF4147 domain-containing protein [Permianibacter sp.]